MNNETSSSFLKTLSIIILIGIVFLLGKIQFKRNNYLNKNKFEELYLFIIIMPPFALLLNNYLYFIDDKTEINFSSYSG